METGSERGLGPGLVFLGDGVGEPANILNLTTNLMLLSGLRPGQDTQIDLTGTWLVKKLYEKPIAPEKSTDLTSRQQMRIHGSLGLRGG